jgi:hypothetical protein
MSAVSTQFTPRSRAWSSSASASSSSTRPLKFTVPSHRELVTSAERPTRT